MRRFRVRHPHRYLRACAAPTTDDRRLVLGLTNRVGMVRREDDRPEAIGSRGGLGKAGFVRGALSAPSNHTPAGRPMRGRCARRIVLPSCPPLLVLRDWSWDESLATACRWGHRTSVVAPYGDGPCAGRFQVVVAALPFDGCDRLTVRCWVLGAAGLGRRPRSAPRGLSRRGGVAIDRHER